MEVGPTENRGFWDMEKKPHYDKNLIAVWSMYAKIHNKLQDYSYRYAKEAHDTGMPIVRPLFIVYPQQKEAWNDWQTYLYGDDILISAIWQKGKDEHSLYLPAGEKWRDAWHPGKIYEGGKTVTVKTPVYQIPIFIRDGSDVDLGDLNALYAESLKLAERKPDLSKLQKSVK
jgi:alpha-glucosidase (family GH31 glycosyl hydrolase)